MKKILAILLSILLSFSIYAQPKNEISIEYGQFTISQFAYVMGGILGVAFTAGHFTFDNTKFIGAVGLGYERYVNSWFGFGGNIYFDYTTSDTYTLNSDNEKVYNGKYNLGIISITPNCKFRWFNKDHFGMYSKIAAGIGIGFSEEDNVIPSFQVSPICLEFGNQSIRGITEIGFGMQGIINVGIKKLF